MIDRSEYDALHRACPACGSATVSRTLLGMAPPNTNRATCYGCGWVGIVDQLVASEQPPTEEEKQEP